MVSEEAEIMGITSMTSRTGKAILCVHIKPPCVMPSRSMIRTQDGNENSPDCVIGRTARYHDN